MQFFKVRKKLDSKKNTLDIYPDFCVGRFDDFMVRGRNFYAVWCPGIGLWSQNEYDVQKIIDDELQEYYDKVEGRFEADIHVGWATSYGSGSWRNYNRWVKDLPDNFHQLDTKVIFSNTEVTKDDYATKRLPYSLEKGPIENYNILMDTLYDKNERQKIEWAIGSVISGESRDIQKFLVFYGETGTGKSTIINIIQKLFEGYYVTFDSKALGSNSDQFAAEVFKNNPIVGIQHDGDLSRIEDNTRINSITSHEEMSVNEKHKSRYTTRIDSFLFMGTNKPVKITDAQSGIIRRLIDVHPSGRKLSPDKYFEIVRKIDFELGAIAQHCLDVYSTLGKNYYSGYRPIDMMFKTDVFFNFVESCYFTFEKQDGCTLKQAYDMYKDYCDESLVEYKMPKYKFREELRNYFRHFDISTRVEGKQVKNYYTGFLTDKFTNAATVDSSPEELDVLTLDKTESIFDQNYTQSKAQYATKAGTPTKKWDKVTTTLGDIDTSKLHFVKVPENHIVIDFDLKGPDGDKCAELNLAAASRWPKTYAEFSKSGAGIHLHYIYDGDVNRLSRLYDDGIEIKVFSGNASLRRKLSYCNDLPIAHISSGLPLKEEKVINFDRVKTEKHIRSLIAKNLRKKIHPATKPSVDFIAEILDEAYSSGVVYDVTDMRNKVLTFAMNSTNNAEYCMKVVSRMHFKSEITAEDMTKPDENDGKIVFYDVEVFPNLFLVNWKYMDSGYTCVRMINPTPQEIEELFKFKLVGFNNRRYDNHILYARYLGYNNEELYNLSQKIVSGQSKNCLFSEAYSLSYTDVYDFASAGNKMSLKKWEIKLGLHHKELGLPWDQPVEEKDWQKVAEYCDNDVISTEAVFKHLSGDFAARQILASLAGMSVNDSTNQLTTKIIFGNDRNPQSEFVYTDLSKEFPGYKFENGKSSYRGEDPGEGGYVYSNPGMYTNVGLFDISSMHPASIVALNLFGDKYTKVFKELREARIYIKHSAWDAARKVLGGILKPYIDALESGNASFTAKDLTQALKTAINSVYGLTSAAFDNKFKDPRNIDNIVAKRGALFMINLKHECESRGWTVVHIKTDSIKLANCTKEMEDFVVEYGKKYQYDFEHEATYDKMCIVNQAVYIAHESYGEDEGKWTATGAQFQHPYVFKTLFSKEKIEFKDKCETKAVQKGDIYLNMNETLPEGSNSYSFVGKVGEFVPIKSGCGGGILVRRNNDKDYAVSGTKGYRWLESETVKECSKEDDIDLEYFRALVDEAVSDISKYGDFEWFASDQQELPWCDKENKDCSKCNDAQCIHNERK